MASRSNNVVDAPQETADPPAVEANKKRSHAKISAATNSKKGADSPPLKEARLEEPAASQPLIQTEDNLKEAETDASKQNGEVYAKSANNEEKSSDEDPESEQDEPPVPLLLQPEPSKMNEEDSAKFHEADQRRSRDDKAVRSTHSKLIKAKAEMVKAQARFEEWYVLNFLISIA